MSRHLTKKHIISYMLYLALASSLILSVSYARYQTKVIGKGTASVAAAAMNTEIDLTSWLSELSPGASAEINFVVTNRRDSIVSEVAQEYTITITTTGNLPLEYTLVPEGTGGAGTYVSQAGNPAVGDTKWEWTGGMLPLSAAEINHTYKLKVLWPEIQMDTSSLGEIDLVTLTVDAKQVGVGTS